MSFTGFNVPTLTEVLDRAKSDIDANVTGADARVRRSVLGVLATVLAGAAKGHYDYLSWVSDQTNTLYADGSNLDLWGRIWSVERKAASIATGTVTFSGTDGTVIPSDTALQRSDGVQYVVTTGGTVSSGSVTVTVEAAEAGDDGNADIGVQMNLVSPIAGLTSAGSVLEITGGSDREKDGDKGTNDDYRGRILDRIAAPPHGGAAADYIQWALEVPGVTRAWVFPQELGAGTVSLRFMMDDTYSDAIPLTADVATVQAYIDDESRRPVTDSFLALAPVAVPQDVTIAGLTPDTTAIRSAIEAELADMIRREAIPGGSIPVSKFWEAISIAAGETSHTLTTPSANVTTLTGQIITLGTVSYT